MVFGPDLIALLVAAATGNASLAAKFDVGEAALAAWQMATGPAAFRRKEREVTNWRLQSTTNLVASLPFTLSVLSGQTPRNLPRCIKLNNYWCIKRAGWAGEIASDEEGHVGFASASEGAQTAALLLRRYYVDFGRHSAYAIVSHWAPAECGRVVVTRLVRRRIAKTGGAKTAGANAGSSSADNGGNIPVGPYAGTLRGRWLAAHSGRVAAGPSRRPVVRSVVPDYTIQTMRTPSIEAGVTEARVSTTGSSLAGASLTGLAMDAPSPTSTRKTTSPASAGGNGPKTDGSRVASATTTVMSCSAETQRITNYAVRASAGITTNVKEDLQLFTPDGNPLPNLEKIMMNMASVEIGPWKADRSLILAAIVKANQKRIAALAAKKAAAAATQPQPPVAAATADSPKPTAPTAEKTTLKTTTAATSTAVNTPTAVDAPIKPKDDTASAKAAAAAAPVAR